MSKTKKVEDRLENKQDGSIAQDRHEQFMDVLKDWNDLSEVESLDFDEVDVLIDYLELLDEEYEHFEDKPKALFSDIIESYKTKGFGLDRGWSKEELAEVLDKVKGVKYKADDTDKAMGEKLNLWETISSAFYGYLWDFLEVMVEENWNLDIEKLLYIYKGRELDV